MEPINSVETLTDIYIAIEDVYLYSRQSANLISATDSEASLELPRN
jgi:hypothetical protein